jgi:hypothetical protein
MEGNKKMKNKNDYAIEVVDKDGKFVSQIDVAESFEEAQDWLKYFVKEKIAGENEHYRITEIEYENEYEEKIEKGICVIGEYDKIGKEI